MSIRTITPEELEALRADGREIALIDVRTPAEFREIHAAMARNVRLDRLDPQAVMKSRDGAAAPLYFICRAGSRGRQAAEKLLKAGYTDAINVEGGTLAWEAAGLAVVRGRKAMSLERQVRIAAGSTTRRTRCAKSAKPSPRHPASPAIWTPSPCARCARSQTDDTPRSTNWRATSSVTSRAVRSWRAAITSATAPGDSCAGTGSKPSRPGWCCLRSSVAW